MHPHRITIILVAMATTIAACESDTESVAEQHPADFLPPKAISPETSGCPAHLAGYCKGWFVTEASTKIRPDHLDLGDRLIIGKKSNGQDPFVWLFARSPEPKGKWGQDMIKLSEITTDADEHDCLAGKLRLEGHDGTMPHEWHRLTLRLKPAVASDVEDELLLEICFTPQDNGNPPTACEMSGCPDDEDPRLHGGRAHAQD